MHSVQEWVLESNLINCSSARAWGIDLPNRASARVWEKKKPDAPLTDEVKEVS
jgi:hypothetical protein